LAADEEELKGLKPVGFTVGDEWLARPPPPPGPAPVLAEAVIPPPPAHSVVAEDRANSEEYDTDRANSVEYDIDRCKWSWRVGKKHLQTMNKQILSPSFQLHTFSQDLEFKMLLEPNPSQRGRCGFAKAEKGSLSLKCVSNASELAHLGLLTCRLGLRERNADGDVSRTVQVTLNFADKSNQVLVTDWMFKEAIIKGCFRLEFELDAEL